ncbi:MAG: VOC family protein [Alphaproteobacteria bacterium]|nr:VOC family protein [Alphaproteobacteria bacterium]
MIKGINHITLAVTDINRSFMFYHDIIGLKPICRWDKGAYFLIDDFWFCLNVDDLRQANLCYTHYAFSVNENDFESMSLRIIESGAFIFKENTSPGASLYFLDPDDHKLEIHVGDWKARVMAKKQDPELWKEIIWF